MTTNGFIRRVIATISLAVVASAGAVVPNPPAAQAAAVGEVGCFISASYHVFLGRQPEVPVVVQWAEAIGSGAPRSLLPESLAVSDQWLGVVVDGLYEDALDRHPDFAGRTYWVGQLRSGVLVNRFGSSVYGSDEFYRRAGSSPESFIAQLYSRILHREADPAGLAYWVSVLEGSSRGGVAAAFFSSPESRHDRVLDLYQRVLGRSPDPAGLGYWMQRLLAENDVRLAVYLASSDEFYRKSIKPGSGCALPPAW